MLTLMACASHATADIVVVVNSNNALTTLSRKQIIDLYMGRTSYFPNGEKALRMDQPINSQTRKNFYQGLVSKSVAEIKSYWARLLFTGRAKPPEEMESALDILLALQDNKNAIAYLDAKEFKDMAESEGATDEIKIIGRIKLNKN